MSCTMQLSIIIPALNEAEHIEVLLKPLQYLRKVGHELILVDGGSTDGTSKLAGSLVDQLLVSEAGRARQMNRGAASAQGDWLLFLHADTRLPENLDVLMRQKLAKTDRQWGRFDLRLSGNHPLFRLIECMINLRARVTGIATGDQCLFVERELFRTMGGYPAIPLMEDVALCKSLKRHSRPLHITEQVETSSRRWEEKGIAKTILLMWWLRWRYFLGASPEKLACHYYGTASS